jgi:hypothetical protein
MANSQSYRLLRRIVAAADAVAYDPAERLERGSLSGILDEILFHADSRYWQFTPTQMGGHSFTDRLLAWLENMDLSEVEIDTLLRTVPNIQFVDRDDLLTLHRSAFQGQIRRWLMDQMDLSFSLPPAEFDDQIALAVSRTWFCPITDSMDISQFHHVNGIEGAAHRPSWRTLEKFGDFQLVQRYMARNNLARLVLLEDFVGSGTQSMKPLRYATTHLCPAVPVLFVPLIISEVGFRRLQDEFVDVPGLRIDPSFVVPLQVHVSADPSENEASFIPPLRSLVQRTFEVVKQPFPPETEPLEEAFGFGSVGTLLVLHSNCPNNTISLIWHRAPEWKALFPRVSRF